MAEQTNISWCDHTFNPVWGCAKVSPGCANCYAETGAKRFGTSWGKDAERRTFGDAHWNEPLRWYRKALRDGVRRRVFCGSMCDWAEDHRVTRHELRTRLWNVIAATIGDGDADAGLDWLLLTKRADHILNVLPPDWGDGWPNVWLGTSIENNDYVWRADALREVPATIRFISYEPALGPLDKINLTGIHWLIYGGESGPGHRPDDPQWAREVRDHCRATGVKFFFKQRSGPRPGMGDLDGELIRELPPWTLTCLLST